MKFTAAGINHLTWFTEVEVDGHDAMPRLKRIAARAAGRRSGCQGRRPSRMSPLALGRIRPERRLSVRLAVSGAFRGLSGSMDRHVTEFFPHWFRGEKSYYGRTLGVDAFPFEAVIELGDDVYRDMEEHAVSPDPLPADYFDGIGGEHEQVVEIIESIRRDAGPDVLGESSRTGARFPVSARGDRRVSRGGRRRRAPARSCCRRSTRRWPARWPRDSSGWRPWSTRPSRAAAKKFLQALLLDGAVPSLEAAEPLADDLASGPGGIPASVWRRLAEADWPMMTFRERLMTVLRGGKADRIPVTIYHWLLPDTPAGKRLHGEGLIPIGSRRVFREQHRDMTIRRTESIHRGEADRHAHRNAGGHAHRADHARSDLRQPLDPGTSGQIGRKTTA